VDGDQRFGSRAISIFRVEVRRQGDVSNCFVTIPKRSLVCVFWGFHGGEVRSRGFQGRCAM